MIGLGAVHEKDETVIEFPAPTYHRDTPPMYTCEKESMV
jgi:hypothetical protein